MQQAGEHRPYRRGIFMTMTASQPRLAIPGVQTILNLMIGGLVGLLIWEVWARVLTKAVIGYPLEPAGLIDAILNHQFGLMLPWLLREAMHYVIGIIGYPVFYYLVSRYVPKWGLVLDIIVLVTFSLGVYAFWPAAADPERTVKASLMFIFYVSVLALIASRALNKSALAADVISWGNFTWLNALGIMAPIGGLSFYLLGEVTAANGALSYMSFAGHVIYGAIAALVFELRERKAAM
jgi:hypothetical protein